MYYSCACSFYIKKSSPTQGKALLYNCFYIARLGPFLRASAPACISIPTTSRQKKERDTRHKTLGHTRPISWIWIALSWRKKKSEGSIILWITKSELCNKAFWNLKFRKRKLFSDSRSPYRWQNCWNTGEQQNVHELYNRYTTRTKECASFCLVIRLSPCACATSHQLPTLTPSRAKGRM